MAHLHSTAESDRQPDASLAHHTEANHASDRRTDTASAPAPERVGSRTTASGPPLFLIGDPSGGDAQLRLLATYLNPDMPIHALMGESLCPPGVRTVEGMARRYVSAIREARPRDPYYLLGGSWGAAVAYEVAAQLIGQDEAVVFLGVLDAPPCPESSAVAKAFGSYMVHQLPIPMHVFAGAESDGGLQQQAGGASPLAWTRALPGDRIRRVLVPGSRDSVLDATQAALLGRAVSEAIQAARTRPAQLLERQYRPQVTIQAGQGHRAPLFCLPGAGASVLSFSALAQELGTGWPVQGLQLRGVEGLLVPHSTVEAAAATHVRAIHEVQPDGPVHLLGHSFGGWVALEVAHRLGAGGRSVASLTIVDSEPPSDEAAPDREYSAQEVLMELLRVLELAAGRTLGIDATRCESLEASACLDLLHGRCVLAGLMPQVSRPEALRGVFRAFAAALRTRYEPPRAYTGAVRLVLLSEPHVDAVANQRNHQSAVASWRRWAPNLAFWHGPGNHVTALKRPHVSALAEWLRKGLEPAREVPNESRHRPSHPPGDETPGSNGARSLAPPDGRSHE